MKFAQDPDPPPASSPDRRGWLPALFVAALVTALATRWPWTEVSFTRLWGSHDGPPGWHTTAGFTALCSGVLVAVMALAETQTPSSRRAVRPSSVVLLVLAAIALAWEVYQGPGMLRGVSAARTAAFWTTCVSLPVLLVVSFERLRALPRRQAH